MSLRYRTTAVLFFLTAALLYAAPDYQIHRVESGESLSSLSRIYNCSIEDLKEINSLQRDMLYRGEELKIPLAYPDSYTVASGDTLSGIAQRYDMDQDKLVSCLNRMNHSVLKTGQVLELIRSPRKGEQWEVRRGDSLSWISLKFDISQERLKQINGMDSASLRVGQILNLTDSRPQTVTIEEGDSLWAVSRRYEVSVEELKAWNNLNSDLLKHGMALQLYPIVLDLDERDSRIITGNPERQGSPAGSVLASANSDAADQAAGNQTTEPEVKLASLDQSPALYYSIPTRRRTQPSASYAEEDLEDSMDNYAKARAVLKDFDEAVHRLPALGRELKGYTVVIDPGHGGLDPGAVVSNSDGNGNTVYVVEDEYAYDIALRVYRGLVRHGADAGLTVISPNHTIRRTEDASITYVNEKNEVYNSRAVNSLDRNHVWPVGGKWGLDQRKVVASEILNGKRRKTLFISIHADNNPGDGAGTRILYHPEERGTQSQELAEVLTEHMGMGSAERAQEVRVLQGNPAASAVLIEVRNLAYKNNAWAIRNEELRQDDADRIVSGIVSYCNSQ